MMITFGSALMIKRWSFEDIGGDGNVNKAVRLYILYFLEKK